MKALGGVDDGRWGVRLERVGRALVVAPSGMLDESEAERLRGVVDSRHGSYGAVVLDLRDLAGFGGAGLAMLLDQQTWAREQGVELAVVAGDVAREALSRLDAARELRVVDDIDEALARYR
jgi:anti-anti-sigma factor